MELILDGVGLIRKERERQIAEGFNIHSYRNNELIDAANTHLAENLLWVDWHLMWPKAIKWEPGKDRIEDLVKAGALIAAEIDRLKRLERE